MSEIYSTNLEKREKISQELNFLISKNNDKLSIYKILNKLNFIIIPILIIYSIALNFTVPIPIHLCLYSLIAIVTFNIHKNKLKIQTLNKKNKHLNSKLEENQLKMQELIKTKENNSNIKTEKELLEIKKQLLVIEYIMNHQKVLQHKKSIGELSNYLYEQGFTKETNTYAYFKTIEIIEEENLQRKRKK